jgi:hypothetical protein
VHRISETSLSQATAVPISQLVANQSKPQSQAELLEARRKRTRKAILEWISHDRIAFSQVQSLQFQEFCASLYEEYLTLIPTSHSTIQSWLMAEFTMTQATIVGQLALSKSTIHLSFDLWTSPHKNIAVLGIVAHYLTPDYTNQAVLLALRRLEGAHNGENQAEIILEVVRLYEINQLGYFVCDNASPNDTAVRAILKSQDKQTEEERRRLRCLGHIINLAAQAFLFGKNIEAFEDGDLEDLETAYQLWQQAGPVGQIHYLVAFIRSTSQRRQDFIRMQGDVQGLQPLLNNQTRWNSTFTMLVRAKQLRRAIDLFCLQYINSGELDASTTISDETWALIDHICEILGLFDFATLNLQGAATEGAHGALWECLPMIETLLLGIEDLKLRYPLQPKQSATLSRRSKFSQSTSLSLSQNPSSDDFIAIGLNNAWLKLEKYYVLTDKSEAYVAAVILNPYRKWAYFSVSWKTKPDWLSTAEKKVRALWDEYRVSHPSPVPHTSPPQPMYQQKDYGRPDYAEEYHKRLYAQDDYTDILEDEYSKYISTGPVRAVEGMKLHPIQWWRTNEGEYPVLAKLAYDLLSIPAMSAEVERVFSGTKELIRDRRNGLDIESIEASECFRSWTSKT